MRILADECCDRRLVAALRADGHDVAWIMETEPGAADEGVAERALREDRLIVTHDFDFGELVVRHRVDTVGVVLVHCPGLLPQKRAERTVGIIEDLGDRLLGQLTIVEQKRVRQRGLV